MKKQAEPNNPYAHVKLKKTEQKLAVSNHQQPPEIPSADIPPPKPPKPDRLLNPKSTEKRVTFGDLPTLHHKQKLTLEEKKSIPPVLKLVPKTIFELIYKKSQSKPTMLLNANLAPGRRIMKLKIFCDRRFAKFLMRKDSDAAQHIERFLQQVSNHYNLLDNTNWRKDKNSYVDTYVKLMQELDLALKAITVNYRSTKNKIPPEAFGEWLVAYADTKFGTEARPRDDGQGSGPTKKKYSR